MKTKVLDAIITTADGAGIWYGIANIKEILGIIVLVVSLIGTTVKIALNIINWYKKAKEDGKITKEEIDEGIGLIKDGFEVVKEGVDTIKQTAEDAKDKE